MVSLYQNPAHVCSLLNPLSMHTSNERLGLLKCYLKIQTIHCREKFMSFTRRVVFQVVFILIIDSADAPTASACLI